MYTAKPWYFSRTIWASLVTILAAFLGLFDLVLGESEQQALTGVLLDLVTAAAGVTAIAGRLLASRRIG